MKNLYLLFSFALMSIFAFGQTPQAFKYQAVARDLNGNPVINQEISVKISILSGSPEGTVEYCELHQTTTNSLGLINLEVGRGTAVTGNFAMISWGNNASFIKTEMDLAGGDNFVFMGTSQLLSVPFSLFSDNGVPDGQNPGDMLYWNGTQWLKVNAGLNGQVLTFNEGVPVWGGVQLPILNTNPINNITAFTAYCGGNIASDGGSPVTARGLCWNSAPNPTTANFKTTNGSGAGSFNANLNALSASTLYYVRAYATNSAGTSYGNEVSFTTTNGSITLTTTAITAITVNSATSGGNITNNGGAAVTMRGVCWNTSPFPTTANSKTTNGPGNGVFVSELTGLEPNTLYYVRAYATNSLGTSYGQQLSFTTLSGIITLTTAEVTEITATTAISGGEITNDGGSPVTVRGVCFSTSQNPTIADSTTNDGNGNGVFVSNLTSLLPDTLYYVRSYATNGVGTYYGNEVSFTTLPFTCGDVVNYGGQNYNTVLIGTQCWFKENLNIGIMIPGASEQTDNGVTEKYCYDNNPENCNIYGGLYQWNEIMNYSTTPGVQGICPPTGGWHLATDAEWTTLTTFLGGESVAGGKMKETGTAHWQTPNTGATNSSGFTALPGGERHSNLSFNNLNFTNKIWSSTQYSVSGSWYMILSSPAANGGMDGSGKAFGFSVRCLKNETTSSQLDVTPANQDVIASTGTTTFEVTSNTSWTIEENASWLSVSPMIGSSNGTLTVSYEANTSSESRIGQISITALGGNPVVNVTVTQAGTPPWLCGQSLTDSRDGQTYPTVQIGTQCWMAKNLNIGTRIDGWPEQANNTVIEKHCYYNSEAQCDIYGGLYQWDEMMEYSTTPGAQGICPTGWHLPTDAEWCTITTYLDATVNCSTTGWSGTNAGGKLKESGTSHWNSPNTGATNSSGFTGLPGGCRNAGGGGFYSNGSDSYYWSSSGVSTTDAWSNQLTKSLANVYLGNFTPKSYGLSVRCLKNGPTLPQLSIFPANQNVNAISGTTTFEITSNTSWTVEESVSWLSVSPIIGNNNGMLTISYDANSSFESRIGQIIITAEGGYPVVNVMVTQLSLSIGDNYGGGKIAYFFQPGDLGYVAGETHGLIAAPNDTTAKWGCMGTTIPGADGTAIGTGNQNTIDIELGCTTTGIAADICANLTFGGYSDWFLPSIDELNMLYINRQAIGGFNCSYYWSSSEYNDDYAWLQYSYIGSHDYQKNFTFCVRAIRTF